MAQDVTGEKLDVLYMAMCLMGMIEDAYQFRDQTDYYVANANLQAVYSNYLTGLEAGFSPAELADHLAGNYAAEMTAENEDYTISVVEIASLAALVDSVDALGQALLAEIDEVGPTLFSLGGLVQRYDNKAPSGLTPADTYADLGDLAGLIAQNLGEYPGIVAAAQAVQAGVADAVVFESHGSSAAVNVDNSHGLAIFFPGNPSSFYYGANNDFAAGTTWGNPESPQGAGGGISWGPLLVAYIAEVNPDGEDDPHPPDPIAKVFEFFEIFLPVIER
jgi:hypothetical protein